MDKPPISIAADPTVEDVEKAARAMCEAWYYAPIDSPDGSAEWRRKQDQYRMQARVALKATSARVESLETALAEAESALNFIAGYAGQFGFPWPETHEDYPAFAVLTSREAIKKISAIKGVVK